MRVYMYIEYNGDLQQLPNFFQIALAKVGSSFSYVSIRQHTSAYVSIRQHTSPAAAS
jgi:hypothetical protein